ncbi:MAG: hypothetical protein Q9161_007068 [Pseudevernia consocians]
MADDYRTHQVGWEEEVDREIDLLFAEAEFSDHSLQPNMYETAHSGAVELEADIDNEIDRLIAEADEVDRDIDRLIAEAGFDMEDTPTPETIGPPVTADASLESATSAGQGSVETGTRFRPSISADIFIPLGSQTALHQCMGSIGSMGGREGTGDIEISARHGTRGGLGHLGDFDESIMQNSKWITSSSFPVLGSSSTADPGLEFLESLPVVKINDLPEGIHSCSLCTEPFEDKEDSETPIRLPCRHIFGKICILRWISSNTCPTCLADIIEPDAFDTLVQNGEVKELSVPSPSLPRHTLSKPTPRVRLPPRQDSSHSYSTPSTGSTKET